jgi:hypothetical protein
MVRAVLFFAVVAATVASAGSGDAAWYAMQLFKNGRYAESWRAWNAALAETQ